MEEPNNKSFSLLINNDNDSTSIVVFSANNASDMALCFGSYQNSYYLLIALNNIK